MRTQWETVWSFNTARFTVALAVAPEDTAPEDGMQFLEDIEFAREGGWHWFQARVQVTFRDDDNPKHWAVARDQVLGEYYLGWCSYHGLKDFMEPGGYFRGMVSGAISEARNTLARMNAGIRKEALFRPVNVEITGLTHGFRYASSVTLL